MGTPAFAVPSLEILHRHHYSIVAVVTAPDQPQGRGQKKKYSPIKKKALDYGIPVLQPYDFQDTSFIETLKSYQANLQIVVAFKILPKIVWNMPALGTFNLHASLLPQYRGAAPIHWAIINGEKKTGLTTFFLDDHIDTGQILLQTSTDISEKITCGTLYETMSQQGAALVLRTTQQIENQKHQPYIQPTLTNIKKAPKIYKKDTIIVWNTPAENVYNFIRGLSPQPGAYTFIQEKQVKILETEKITIALPLKPGAIHTDQKNYLYIGTATTPLSITILQMPGKKSMTIKNFLLGNKIE